VASDQVSFDILPVDVALDAEHNRTELIIGADRAAGDRAFDVEPAARTRGRGPIALAESVAAIEADIEAGPGENRRRRNVDGRRSRRWGGGRKVGSEGRGCGSERQCADDQYTLHTCLLSGTRINARWLLNGFG